ncbi:hypothetical protein NKR23_g2068 [Pleurostoma richardsiae]|uniref:Uncharacterized protein n=1 Tax=Pleurostoma richardsiae TaxID=41990 RepID=A0AA38S3R7_9PEZI|nr:hypothetical protein NKR23_g2068 [Pleurostoma richardsiae]
MSTFSKGCCVAPVPRWIYGWCPGCEGYYRPADIRNEVVILNYWQFKNKRGWWARPAHPSTVPGSVLFDTSRYDEDKWPATADLAPFLRSVDDVLSLGKRDADKLKRAAERIRDSTLAWARREEKSLIPTEHRGGVVPAEPQSAVSHKAQAKKVNMEKPLPPIPEQKVGGRFPLFIEPQFESVVPTPIFYSPAPETILHLSLAAPRYVSASEPNFPHVVDLYHMPSRDRSPSPSQSCRPSTHAPPRPAVRLASCRTHGKRLDADCEQCDRILLPDEIAIPPDGSEDGRWPAVGWEELACAVQATCFCDFYMEQDYCHTCRARRTVEQVIGGGMEFI